MGFVDSARFVGGSGGSSKSSLSLPDSPDSSVEFSEDDSALEGVHVIKFINYIRTRWNVKVETTEAQ